MTAIRNRITWRFWTEIEIEMPYLSDFEGIRRRMGFGGAEIEDGQLW
jgi:hypothetical protein